MKEIENYEGINEYSIFFENIFDFESGGVELFIENLIATHSQSNTNYHFYNIQNDIDFDSKEIVKFFDYFLNRLSIKIDLLSKIESEICIILWRFDDNQLEIAKLKYSPEDYLDMKGFYGPYAETQVHLEHFHLLSYFSQIKYLLDKNSFDIKLKKDLDNLYEKFHVAISILNEQFLIISTSKFLQQNIQNRGIFNLKIDFDSESSDTSSIFSSSDSEFLFKELLNEEPFKKSIQGLCALHSIFKSKKLFNSLMRDVDYIQWCENLKEKFKITRILKPKELKMEKYWAVFNKIRATHTTRGYGL